MTRRQGILCCPSCRMWRSWHSEQERPRIDRRCIKCGKRIRVQLDRKGRGRSSTLHSQGQGRRRVVEVKELPQHMPWHSVHKALREHNKYETSGKRARWLIEGGSESFTRASLIDPEARAGEVPMIEWDRIQDQVKREVGESDESEA